MLRRRRLRLHIAMFAVFSLLFAQLALASHVCPQVADARAMAAMMQAGQACDGMDMQQPALCHQHASDSAKNFEALKLPSASPPAVVQVIELPALPEFAATFEGIAAATPEAHPPADPLFLATLRLRV